MTIKSDKDYISGQPRLDGHRLSVAHIVANISQVGLESFVNEFDLHGEEGKLKEAIEYCRNEQCVSKVISYCQGCNKNVTYSGEDLWKVAERINI